MIVSGWWWSLSDTQRTWIIEGVFVACLCVTVVLAVLVDGWERARAQARVRARNTGGDGNGT